MAVKALIPPAALVEVILIKPIHFLYFIYIRLHQQCICLLSNRVADNFRILCVAG